MWNRKVFIRIIEVLLCIACLVALRVTNDESSRVQHYWRNRSRDWFLLDNVTWGMIGAAVATATCGGYVIITAGLLIAAATGELRGRKTELFFLGLGIILFAIVGALCLASIEDVPRDLIDNAAVLGGLCLVTALVFIADLLTRPPKKKENPSTTQIFVDKDTAKRLKAALTTEKETKASKADDTAASPKTKEPDDGVVNDGFEKMDQPRTSSSQDYSEDDERPEQDHETTRTRARDAVEDERNRKFEHVERELREYKQNFENGRVLRNSRKYRGEESMERNHGRNGSYDPHLRLEDSRVIYKAHDIYQRPVDEVDTPRFPTDLERRSEPIFAKIINPAVKIMKVERDVEEAIIGAYRYSDTSQYDNVPVKLRGTSPPGILKKARDVSFNVPPPPRDNGNGLNNRRNEAEMLDDCFGPLKSTGTQTNSRPPSTPTDPGYVRHTASNWPQEIKTKTPGSSPEHSMHQ